MSVEYHRSRGEKIHIRRLKALKRKQAEKTDVSCSIVRPTPFSQDKLFPQLPKFRELLEMDREKAAELVANSGYDFRRDSNDTFMQMARNLGNATGLIQVGKISDLETVAKVISKVGPLVGLFNSFGFRNYAISYESNDLLNEIKGMKGATK